MPISDAKIGILYGNLYKQNSRREVGQRRFLSLLVPGLKYFQKSFKEFRM